MNVHFSSKSDEWETPQELFDKYNAIYNFKLDACATKKNTKCQTFYTKETDSLSDKAIWYNTTWCNPPYGRSIGLWMKKAYESSLSDVTVVCLIPARTDTKWWHTYVIHGEIEFIKGRLKFGGHKNSAPFPSAIVVFRGKND